MSIPGAIRERADALSGRKAMASTRAFHTVVGKVVGVRDDHVVMQVRGREVLVEGSAIVSLAEVPEHHAEYVI